MAKRAASASGSPVACSSVWPPSRKTRPRGEFQIAAISGERPTIAITWSSRPARYSFYGRWVGVHLTQLRVHGGRIAVPPARLAKQTRSATRRLARRARKEKRHASQVNHKISKEIVSVAQRTGRGIAVEELGGIRERVRLRRDQRSTLSSWPFHQLGQNLACKAKRAGVPFVAVDARHTSQRCPRCGHTERANRPDRDRFCCRRCGLAGPADVVAGVNVRDRARSAWVFVTAPAPSP